MPDDLRLPEPWASCDLRVVVPTYNEAANLARLAEALFALALPGLHLIVVDDGSPDGTGDVADKLAAEHPGRVTALHRSAKDGLGRAYVAGLSRALDDGARFVAQMDADLSHSPAYLPQMLGTAHSTGAGLVIGSRYVPGAALSARWGRHRRLLSDWANTYARTMLNLPVRDITSGFKLWSRDALQAVGPARIASSGYSVQVELHYRAYTRGQKIVEIPIHFEDRSAGSSKMRLADQVESAVRPLKLRGLL